MFISRREGKGKKEKEGKRAGRRKERRQGWGKGRKENRGGKEERREEGDNYLVREKVDFSLILLTAA